MAKKYFLFGLLFGVLVLLGVFVGLVFLPTLNRPTTKVAIPESNVGALSPVAITGTIQIPSYLRSEWQGNTFLRGGFRQVLEDGGLGIRDPELSVRMVLPLKFDQNGAGKFELAVPPSTIARLASIKDQRLFLSISLCHTDLKQTGPMSGPSNELCSPTSKGVLGLGVTMDVSRIRQNQAQDIGTLKPLVHGTSNIPGDFSCKGPNKNRVSGVIRPTSDFLKLHPPGTPVLFLLRGRKTSESFFAAQLSNKALLDFTRSEKVASFFSHVQPMKVSANEMKFQAELDSPKLPDDFWGHMVVCGSGESQESCLRKAVLTPATLGIPTGKMFTLIGENLRLVACGEESFTFHLHSFSPSADKKNLPKELLELDVSP